MSFVVEPNPLPRVPGLTWLSAGQLDGMNDEVRSPLKVDETIVSKMTLTDEVKSLLNFFKNNRFQNDIKGDGGVDGQWKECQHSVP